MCSSVQHRIGRKPEWKGRDGGRTDSRGQMELTNWGILETKPHVFPDPSSFIKRYYLQKQFCGDSQYLVMCMLGIWYSCSILKKTIVTQKKPVLIFSWFSCMWLLLTFRKREHSFWDSLWNLKTEPQISVWIIELLVELLFPWSSTESLKIWRQNTLS